MPYYLSSRPYPGNIRLSGNAADYTVALSGSSAVFDDGDSRYSIPVGTAGTRWWARSSR